MEGTGTSPTPVAHAPIEHEQVVKRRVDMQQVRVRSCIPDLHQLRAVFEGRPQRFHMLQTLCSSSPDGIKMCQYDIHVVLGRLA